VPDAVREQRTGFMYRAVVLDLFGSWAGRSRDLDAGIAVEALRRGLALLTIGL
jgi:hypothetical protein